MAAWAGADVERCHSCLRARAAVRSVNIRHTASERPTRARRAAAWAAAELCDVTPRVQSDVTLRVGSHVTRRVESDVTQHVRALQQLQPPARSYHKELAEHAARRDRRRRRGRAAAADAPPVVAAHRRAGVRCASGGHGHGRDRGDHKRNRNRRHRRLLC
eukprot:144375-Chlamydomonas_euryale.AAC.2